MNSPTFFFEGGRPAPLPSLLRLAGRARCLVSSTTVPSKSWLLIVIGLALFACAGGDGVSRPDDRLGSERTIDYFDATTILETADAWYEEADWPEAAAEYERFLDLHALHPQATYALFRLGMSYVHQVTTPDRDLEPAFRALAALRDVVEQAPESIYAIEAQEQVAEMRRVLAKRTLYIGRFYVIQKAYPAATSRLQQVLDEYGDLDEAGDALYWLARVHMAEGEQGQAIAALERLFAEYPASALRGKARKLLATLRPGP